MEDSTLADDLLNGVAEIAEFLGWSQRKTYYELGRSGIPGFKIGQTWHATKSGLRSDIERRAATGVSAG